MLVSCAEESFQRQLASCLYYRKETEAMKLNAGSAQATGTIRECLALLWTTEKRNEGRRRPKNGIKYNTEIVFHNHPFIEY